MVPIHKQETLDFTYLLQEANAYSGTAQIYTRSSLLPAPPDVRKVVARKPLTSMELPSWARMDTHTAPVEFGVANQQQLDVNVAAASRTALPQITSANTTLIGGYISTVFPDYHAQWLIQSQGNATFESVLEGIKDESITIMRKYIFFELGSNQIRSADRVKIFQWILNLVVAVREKNKDARIHFLGILPRPVENQEAKPYITRANRWMASAVTRVDALFNKVRFLPVHLDFLRAEGPKIELFHQDDMLTLNQAGAKTLKASVFYLAGFVKNT